MSESVLDWPDQLQNSLNYWASERHDLAGRGFQKVLLQINQPDQAIWRALVYNQLALLSDQMGHWQYAKEQWELSQQNWRQSGLSAGSNEIQASIDWYTQLLKRCGFEQRADNITQLQQQHRPPLLDPWTEAPSNLAPSTVCVAATTAQTIKSADTSPIDYAPLGGQLLSSKSPVIQRSASTWNELVSQALQAAIAHKLQDSLSKLDEAKNRTIGQKHIQALIYNTEALCSFLAGDYSQTSLAYAEAVNIWQSVEKYCDPYANENHQLYIAALINAGQEQAAQIFAQRHQQKHCPLINPWDDLESNLQKGNWEVAQFNLLTDWSKRIEKTLQAYIGDNLQQAQKESGLLEQKMSPEQMQQCPGALLLQVQAIIAYAAGDYDAAQIIFNKGNDIWKSLKITERQKPPYLQQCKQLMKSHELGYIAELIGEQLCDPFVAYKARHQMQQLSTENTQESTQDPREEWESQLKQAWELAKKKHWEIARRHCVKAEKAARLLGQGDLRICYSLNSLAIFAHAAGDYNDSNQLQEEAVRAWRQGSQQPAARTAFVEFCSLLRESQWLELATTLEKNWDTPGNRSALSPVFLSPEALSSTAMQIMETTSNAEPDDNALHLPSLPPTPKFEEPNLAKSGNSSKFILVLLILVILGCTGVYLYMKFRH